MRLKENEGVYNTFFRVMESVNFTDPTRLIEAISPLGKVTRNKIDIGFEEKK